MPPKRTTHKEPAAQPAVEPEAEPEGALEPVPGQGQLDRLEQGLGRILGVLEVQGGELVETKEALVRAEAQTSDLLARITALEERGAPAPAPAAGAAAAAAAAPAPSPPSAPSALEARLAELEAKVAATSAAKKAEAEVEDPADLLDYVPYHEGRGLNPHPVRPNGVTDKPQLYRLKGLYEVYDFLFKNRKAAYHEFGTLAPVLSYLWDLQHFFEAWSPEFAKSADPEAPLAIEAIRNSLSEVYGLLNRRKNILEIRAVCESQSPNFQPTAEQRKLFDYLSAKCEGFSNNHGLDASIDPLFKSIIVKFEKEAQSAAFKEMSKSAGASRAGGATPSKPKPKKPSTPAPANSG